MDCIKIFLLVAISAYAAEALGWKNCDSSAPAKVLNFRLSPDNLVIVRPGQKIALKAEAELAGNPGVNYRIKLDIKKKFELNKPAQCPPPQGKRGLGPNGLSITIPRKVSQVPSFIGSGSYKVKGEVFDINSGRRVACVQAWDIRLKF